MSDQPTPAPRVSEGAPPKNFCGDPECVIDCEQCREAASFSEASAPREDSIGSATERGENRFSGCSSDQIAWALRKAVDSYADLHVLGQLLVAAADRLDALSPSTKNEDMNTRATDGEANPSFIHEHFEEAVETAKQIEKNYLLYREEERVLASAFLALRKRFVSPSAPQTAPPLNGDGSREAEQCERLAVWLDEKRIPGNAVVLSQRKAAEIQSALEDAASEYRLRPASLSSPEPSPSPASAAPETTA